MLGEEAADPLAKLALFVRPAEIHVVLPGRRRTERALFGYDYFGGIPGVLSSRMNSPFIAGLAMMSQTKPGHRALHRSMAFDLQQGETR
jgi:hypothetical protein